ncbi:hypothetical protein ACJX0J_008905, partial [Zea mays]
MLLFFIQQYYLHILKNSYMKTYKWASNMTTDELRAQIEQMEKRFKDPKVIEQFKENVSTYLTLLNMLLQEDNKIAYDIFNCLMNMKKCGFTGKILMILYESKLDDVVFPRTGTMERPLRFKFSQHIKYKIFLKKSETFIRVTFYHFYSNLIE